jgi:hypothetical protein
MTGPLAPHIYCDAPAGETEFDFWRRQSAQNSKRLAEMRRTVSHLMNCLDAAYAVIRRHRAALGLDATLDAAREELEDMLQELEES